MCFIFLFLSFVAQHATADPLSFSKIRKKHRDLIYSAFPSLKNRPPTPSEVDEIIRLVTKTKEYSFIRGLQLQNSVLIEAIPLNFIGQFYFTGNREISSRHIRAISDLQVGQKIDKQTVINAGENIKKYYQDQGFLNVEVEAHVKSSKNNLTTIHFSIIENQPTLLKQIVIETNNLFLKKKIQGIAKEYLDHRYSANRTQDIIQQIKLLLKTHRFLTAELPPPVVELSSDKSQATLRIVVKKDTKFEIVLSGNSAVSTLDIYRSIDLDNFEVTPFDPSLKILEKVKLHYLELGYANVKIKVKTQDNEKQQKRWLYLAIEEGTPVSLRRIHVSGRISRPSSYYETFIRNNSSRIISNGLLNKDDLEKGYKNLNTELKNQGYLKSKINSSRIELLNKKRSAIVYLAIDEGPLTQIRKIDFKGNDNFPYQDLLLVVPIKNNSPLSLNKLEESTNVLRNFYHDAGFLEMRLLNSEGDLVVYNKENTEANVVYKIYEGPKIKINKIVFEGNTFTKDSVISNEISFKPGMILTPELIEDNLARLNSLGIFSRVDITTLEKNTTISERTLVISVVERDPGIFNFGVGVNSELDLTLRGFTGISYNNLWGTGRGVSLRVELSDHIKELNYLTHKITLGYLEPFLFHSRNRGRINLTRLRTLTSINDDSSADVKDSNRLDLLLERDLMRDLKLTWTFYSLESVKTFPIRNKDPEPSVTKQIVTVGPTIDYDKRDNPFLPTKGYYARWSYHYSSEDLGSSTGIRFYKTQATMSHYMQFGSQKDLIWANSLRGGYLENLSRKSGSGVPDSHVFFLGGSTTLRGFDASNSNDRIPQEYLFDKTVWDSDLIVQKSSSFYLYKSEFRFPIVNNFGGVLFYDAGRVDVYGIYQPEPFRHSAGFGFRYNTPVGPVNFEFAFKLNSNGDPNRDESLHRIHFHIGTF